MLLNVDHAIECWPCNWMLTFWFRMFIRVLYFCRDSDDPTEMSLFETLRETIYSEVATLISQNESRPHYLIKLFRELQLLTTDYLRQRVLYDLKDVFSKYLVEEDPVSEVSCCFVCWRFKDDTYKVFIRFLYIRKNKSTWGQWESMEICYFHL